MKSNKKPRGPSALRFGWPLLVLGVLAPTVAHADCMLVMEPTQSQVIIRYNPLELGMAYRETQVAITNRGTSDCIGSIGASLRGQQFGMTRIEGGQPILYQLVDEKARQDITPRDGQNLIRNPGSMIRLAPGEQSMERLLLTVVPDNSVSQGRYTQTVDLNVQAVDGTLLGVRPLTLGIDIVPAAVLGLKGEVGRARGAATINLGELTRGFRPLPASLYVISTGGYRVSASSLNQGRLKHASSSWFVSYRLFLGKFGLDLRRSDSFEVVSERARNDSYPVSIEIGDVEGKRAGDYTDTVTFTVAAL